MRERIDYALLHGGVQGSWVWAETLAALREQAGGGLGRALALDIPGCGTKRGRATDGLGPDEIAAELIADIEAAGLRDLVLVGHSQAGTILPRLIELRPQLFRRVVYVSALAPPPGRGVLDYRADLPPARTGADDLSPSDDPGAVLKAMFCNDMTGEQTAAFMGELGPDAWPALTYQASDWRYAHLGGTPASYVLCLRDACLPPPWQEVFAERLMADRRVRVDAGHQVMNTRPHALAEILRREAEVG
jgi:pimeloyl-ACP methyl ester carboxylesterase